MLHFFSLCQYFLYADDILLIAPTVTALQVLLDACEDELQHLGMRINVQKSTCIRFGLRCDVTCECLISSQGGLLHWTKQCRYLGVYFVSNRVFRSSFSQMRSNFYRAFNGILSKVGRCASEEVVLHLLKSKCLPVLLYGVESCPVLSRDKQSLEFTVTRCFIKLFRTHSPAVVKDCQIYFSFLPIVNQIDIRTVCFLEQFVDSENYVCSLFERRALDSIRFA